MSSIYLKLSFLDVKTDNCATPIHPVATANTDYTSKTNELIRFAINEDTKTAEVSINNDDGNVDFENEEFCVYLIYDGDAACSDRGEIITSEIRVNIENDDSKYICFL